MMKTVQQIKNELNAVHSTVPAQTRITAYRNNIIDFGERAEEELNLLLSSSPRQTQFWFDRMQESLNTVTACRELIIELEAKIISETWQGNETRSGEGRQG